MRPLMGTISRQRGDGTGRRIARRLAAAALAVTMVISVATGAGVAASADLQASADD